MRIANVMLSLGRGGLEQASLNYASALKQAGHPVLFVTSPAACINQSAGKEGVELAHVSNLGSWDLLATHRLRRLCERFGADVIITHGNRSLVLAAKAQPARTSLMAVVHNYQHQHLHRADALICITESMCKMVTSDVGHKTGQPVYHVPNMIMRDPKPKPYQRHDPPRIGAMGRFVPKKGFDIWLKALARLYDCGYRFEAWLGGAGEEEEALRLLTRQLGIESVVRFVGWIEDTRAFYRDLDLFCVPSLSEPFGIVVLEALAMGVPVIASDCAGPRDILTGADCGGMLVASGDAHALSEGMRELLDHPQQAEQMARQAHAFCLAHYHQRRIVKRISAAIEATIAQPAAVS